MAMMPIMTPMGPMLAPVLTTPMNKRHAQKGEERVPGTPSDQAESVASDGRDKRERERDAGKGKQEKPSPPPPVIDDKKPEPDPAEVQTVTPVSRRTMGTALLECNHCDTVPSGASVHSRPLPVEVLPADIDPGMLRTVGFKSGTVQIPIAAFLRICSYLRPIPDLIRMSCVCRTFRRVLQVPVQRA